MKSPATACPMSGRFGSNAMISIISKGSAKRMVRMSRRDRHTCIGVLLSQGIADRCNTSQQCGQFALLVSPGGELLPHPQGDETTIDQVLMCAPGAASSRM